MSLYHHWPVSHQDSLTLAPGSWPDCLDNTVAGGITEDDCPLDSIIRECGEEASLPAVWVQKNLSPAGLVTYVRKDELDWLFPECQYVVSFFFALLCRYDGLIKLTTFDSMT